MTDAAEDNYAVSEPQCETVLHRRVSVRVVEHELFGTLLAPERPNDLSLLMSLVAGPSSPIGWRGQASLRWRIDSGLVRRVRRHVKAHPEALEALGDALPAAARTVEQRLVARARLAGHDRHDGRELSDLELLAMLQHHGAGTRLLDCTANAYVALWFACRELPDQHGLIAAFGLEEAHHVRHPDELARPMPELLDAMSETFGAWRPSALTPRIAAQQGLFVFSEAVDERWGSVRFRGETLERTGDVPGLSIFVVSRRLKATMCPLWPQMFGYTAESLYPDLDGFSRVHGAVEELPPEFLAIEDDVLA